MTPTPPYSAASDVAENLDLFTRFGEFARSIGRSDLVRPRQPSAATTRDETDFDWAVVGGSPLAMAKAAYLSAAGYKVVLIDERERLGGAWGDLTVFNLAAVQRSTHILTPNQRGYRFIENVLGQRLIEMDPQPICLDAKTGERHPYPMDDKPFKNFAGYEGTVRFLAGGSRNFVNDLAAANHVHGTDIQLGTTVNAITFRDSGTELSLNDGRRLTASRVALTQGSAVAIYGTPERMLYNPHVYMNYSLFLLVEAEAPILSFAHIINHAFVREFQDITLDTPGTAQGQRLWVFRLSRDFATGGIHGLPIDDLIRDLESFAITQPCARVVDISLQTYVNRRMPRKLLDALMTGSAGRALVLPFGLANKLKGDTADSDEHRGAQDLSLFMNSDAFLTCFAET
ncbi:MAG: FAD-dependent oxidoreductase [Rhodospirillales bacterium]